MGLSEADRVASFFIMLVVAPPFIRLLLSLWVWRQSADFPSVRRLRIRFGAGALIFMGAIGLLWGDDQFVGCIAVI